MYFIKNIVQKSTKKEFGYGNVSKYSKYGPP